jgi:hypothetical protein
MVPVNINPSHCRGNHEEVRICVAIAHPKNLDGDLPIIGLCDLPPIEKKEARWMVHSLISRESERPVANGYFIGFDTGPSTFVLCLAEFLAAASRLSDNEQLRSGNGHFESAQRDHSNRQSGNLSTACGKVPIGNRDAS